MAKSKFIRAEIKGIEQLNEQLDELVAETKKGVLNGLKQATKNIKEFSIIACKVNDGQLRNAIHKVTKHEFGTTEKYVGTVYVDINEAPYALYVYYGTGEYAEKASKGKKEWFVPVSKVSKDVSKYHWRVHKGMYGKEDYYVVRGQKPNHFLEDGFNATKNINLTTIAQAVKNAIEGCL